jgi:hypothetical protein
VLFGKGVAVIGTMHRGRWGLYAAVVWLALASALPASSSTDLLIREKLIQLSVQTSRSASGRFVVSCRDTRLHLPVLLWAERAYGEVQQQVGGLIHFDQRQITILVVPEGAEPRIEARLSPMMFRQRLQLPAPMLGTPEADGWLVRTLLGAWPTEGGGWGSCTVPEWLWAGISGQMGHEQRARAMDAALDAWRTGHLAVPAQLLGVQGVTPVSDHHSSVALVRWFASTDAQRRFKGVFGHLAAEGERAASEYVVTELTGGDAGHLHDAWERWLQTERDVVHAVGMVSLRLLRRFEEELLLTEGVCGIPSGGFGGHIARFSDLQGFQNAAWFSGFAREKCSRLSLMAAGRGRPLVELSKAYVDYVLALRTGRDRLVSASLLEVAEAKHAALVGQLTRESGVFFEPVALDGEIREAQ